MFAVSFFGCFDAVGEVFDGKKITISTHFFISIGVGLSWPILIYFALSD